MGSEQTTLSRRRRRLRGRRDPPIEQSGAQTLPRAAWPEADRSAWLRAVTLQRRRRHSARGYATIEACYVRSQQIEASLAHAAVLADLRQRHAQGQDGSVGKTGRR